MNTSDRSRTFWQSRLLIVDDEIFVRRLVRRMMTKLAFAEIEEAEDGEEALGKFKHFKPDMIISDVNMEPMNGLELLKRIRTGRTELLRDVPVIMLTGDTDLTVLGNAIGLDANAFLAKPIGPSALSEKINRCFDEPIPIKDIADYEKIILASKDEPDTGRDFDSNTMIVKTIHQLVVGDVIAMSLYGETGALLIAEGTTIGKLSLGTLRDLADMGQIVKFVVIK